MNASRAHRPGVGAAMAVACVVLLGVSVVGCKAGAGKAQAAEGASSPAADKAQGGAVAVAVVRPVEKTVQGELSLNGTIRAANEVQVVAETSGKVVEVLVKVGSKVATGDVLARLDDELKRASFETAKAAFDKSEADWARAQDLFAQKVISEVDLQGLKLARTSANANFIMARRDLENAHVRAPQSGVVTKTQVSVGSMLGPGAPVANIVDTANLKMTVQVGEREVLKIREGMAVKVESDLYPGSRFSGEVSGVSPKGDSALSFPVEIDLRSDPRRPLFDGMSAKAGIDLGARRILAIPRSSLVGSYQKPQAYVLRGGAARLVDIVVGGEYGTDLEVLRGLSASDEVVAGGQNNLYDGAPVAVSR
jgi:membrane fusion protein, multidrug efflux system